MELIKTDILIIGGGIAGCIAAISLADQFRVTVVDKYSEPKERIGESLAPAASRILSVLNLDRELASQEGTVFKPNLGMQSFWGSDQIQVVDHLRNPDGYVKSLDRQAFEKFLRKQAEKKGVHCLWGTKFVNQTKSEGWKVNLQKEDQKSTIHASYIIDASGRPAFFARSLGIKRQTEDKLVACWMTLLNTDENTMSTISSDENGWWYSAVAPNDKRIVAFHTDSDLVEKQQLKSKEALMELAQSNSQISSFLEDGSGFEFQGTVAANSSKLMQVVGERWAAIGDAAVSFDPLSSQGMFNAMASAMQLRDLILVHGFGNAVSEVYQQQIDQIWNHYLGHRNSFYGAEQRWVDSPFWKRRQMTGSI